MGRCIAISSLLFFSACGPVPASGGAETTTESLSDELCVMQVPGAGLETDELEDGYALIFTTVDPTSLPTLRHAVQLLAAAYAQGARDHAHEHAEDEPEAQEHYVYQGFEDARVEVVPIDRGARIELHSSNGGSVSQIRERAEIEARMMRRGACPLLPPDLEPLPMGG